VPRIGQEVLVDFLEGDPDRPIVVGRVYNAEQPPPCNPAGGGVVSGMRSKTHKGAGYNAMEMDDTAGKEKISIHAQYDMETEVGHDDKQTVTNDRTIKVDGKHTETIVKDTAITVTTGNHTQTISAGTQTNTVSKQIVIQSQTAAIHITAATEIKLEVGSSKLLMKADGSIELSGVSVGVKGTAKVAISGGQVSSSADTTHDIKGAMVMSDGSATNTVKGGMVMLNP
jgi:type VI secretion system secreted protein VgrG